MYSSPEHPESPGRPQPTSVALYHQMQEHGLVPRRVELIRGWMIEKPRKSPLHVQLRHRLDEVLRDWSADHFSVWMDNPLTLSDSEPEPDLIVLAQTRDEFIDHHPSSALLVVEISDGSDAMDRNLLPAYAAAGVAEVWLVLGGKKQIERHTLPVGERYAESRLFSPGDTLISVALEGLSLSMDTLFNAPGAMQG